jgi:hypothetical protein
MMKNESWVARRAREHGGLGWVGAGQVIVNAKIVCGDPVYEILEASRCETSNAAPAEPAVFHHD